MFNFITGLVLILFFMIMVIYHKINIFEILMTPKKDKLSSRRFGMMVCLFLLVEIGRDLIHAAEITKGDIIVLIFFGVLAFSPQLLGKLIDKLLEVYGKKNEK